MNSIYRDNLKSKKNRVFIRLQARIRGIIRRIVLPIFISIIFLFGNILFCIDTNNKYELNYAHNKDWKDALDIANKNIDIRNAELDAREKQFKYNQDLDKRENELILRINAFNNFVQIAPIFANNKEIILNYTSCLAGQKK